jgi:hypothetical protein
MILAGLVTGRWWRWSIPLGGVAWAALLLIDGVVGDWPGIVGGALFGAANTAVGAGLFLLGRALVRSLRRAFG